MRGKMKQPHKGTLRLEIIRLELMVDTLRAQLAAAQQTDWRVLSFVAIATCGFTLLGLTLAGLLS